MVVSYRRGETKNSKISLQKCVLFISDPLGKMTYTKRSIAVAEEGDTGSINLQPPGYWLQLSVIQKR